MRLAFVDAQGLWPRGSILSSPSPSITKSPACVSTCTSVALPRCSTIATTPRRGASAASVSERCWGTGRAVHRGGDHPRLLEVLQPRCWKSTPAERRARVRPGCVLDDLNQQVAPLGLQFAPDISTANRATIGGMIANNSSGTHSDHSRQDRRPCPGTARRPGRRQHVHARPLDRERTGRASAGQPDLEGALLSHRPPAGQGARRRRSSAAIRRSCAASAATTSIAFTWTRSEFNLAHLFVGSEGTLGVVVEAKLRLVELPKAKARARRAVPRSARSPGGDAARSSRTGPPPSR